MKNNYLRVVLISCLIILTVSGVYPKNALSDGISITVPGNVITNVISAALPLNLETGDSLKGSLWIDSIHKISIGSNKVSFDMNIRGENVKFETKLGNQVLLMDIGNLNADFSCNASLRYDAPKRLLYITPYIVQKPSQNSEDEIGANLLQLLSLASGVEYPVELKDFEPFITEISRDQFQIDMDITNIYTENGKVFISAQPKLKKLSQSLKN